MNPFFAKMCFMQRIALALPSQLPLLEKAARRADMDFEKPFFDEERFLTAANERRAYVLKDGLKTISLAALSFFPLEEIYGNDLPKQNELLDRIGYYGEPLLFLESIFTDPFYKGKGNARSLFLSLVSSHKDATWLALLQTSRLSLLPFFKALGFKPYDYAPGGSLILIRKKEKEGLCANPSF